MQRHVKVDGKVRTDATYPAGFMDVVEIAATTEQFRLIYDPKVPPPTHPRTHSPSYMLACRHPHRILNITCWLHANCILIKPIQQEVQQHW